MAEKCKECEEKDEKICDLENELRRESGYKDDYREERNSFESRYKDSERQNEKLKAYIADLEKELYKDETVAQMNKRLQSKRNW
jgi:hypothetical protein